jgi:hypothetical protein
MAQFAVRSLRPAQEVLAEFVNPCSRQTNESSLIANLLKKDLKWLGHRDGLSIERWREALHKLILVSSPSGSEQASTVEQPLFDNASLNTGHIRNDVLSEAQAAFG